VVEVFKEIVAPVYQGTGHFFIAENAMKKSAIPVRAAASWAVVFTKFAVSAILHKRALKFMA